MIRAKWRVGEADVPVDLVAAEESQVDPAVPGGGGGLAHRGGPVLVVAEGQHGARAIKQVRVGVQVDVGGVAQRDAACSATRTAGSSNCRNCPAPDIACW